MQTVEPLAPELTIALTMAVTSSSIRARCCYVRLCSKAGGLGSGMGLFVLKPLTAALAAAGEAAAEAVRRGEGVLAALSRCRSVLHVLLALCTRPALKVPSYTPLSHNQCLWAGALCVNTLCFPC